MTSRIVEAILATVVACAAALFVWRPVQLQMASSRWPTVPGHIVRSQILTTVSHSKGRTLYHHASDISYAYRVQDQNYMASQVRFAPFGPWVPSDLVIHYPKAASVTVSYDPQDPQTAVLLPGASAWDALFLLAVWPLGAYAIAKWLAVQHYEPPQATVAGFRIVDNNRVVLDETTPITAALTTAGMVAVIVTLGVVATMSNGGLSPLFDPSAWVLGAYAGIVALALLVGRFRAVAMERGQSEIGLFGGTLKVWPQQIPFKSLTGCKAVQIPKAWAVRVYWTDAGTRRQLDVVSLSDRTTAETLAAWLVQRCGVQAGAAPSAQPISSATVDVHVGPIVTLIIGTVIGVVLWYQVIGLTSCKTALAAYDAAPQRHLSVTVGHPTPAPGVPLLLNGRGHLRANLTPQDVASLHEGDTVVARLYEGDVTEIQFQGRTLQTTDNPPARYRIALTNLMVGFSVDFALVGLVVLVRRRKLL